MWIMRSTIVTSWLPFVIVETVSILLQCAGYYIVSGNTDLSTPHASQTHDFRSRTCETQTLGPDPGIAKLRLSAQWIFDDHIREREISQTSGSQHRELIKPRAETRSATS